MKLMFDCQAIQGFLRLYGIGRYSRDLLDTLLTRSEIELSLLISTALPEPDRLDELAANANIVYWTPITPSPFSQLECQWRYRVNERLRDAVIRKHQPDVVLVCSHFDGFGEDTVTPTFITPSTPHITIIHDLIHLIYPEVYLITQPLKAFYLQKVAHLADTHMVATISDATRQDVLKLTDARAEKVVNIGCGVPRFLLGQQSERNVAPYLLFVGDGNPRKNHDYLVRSAALMREFNINVPIVCVGKLSDSKLAQLQALRDQLQLSAKHIDFVGFVDDARLIELYAGAAALVFPSKYEGFGLPLAEAMHFGLPILAADTLLNREILGDDAGLFDLTDERTLVDKVDKLHTDKVFKTHLEQVSKHALTKLNWDNVVDRLIACAEQLSAAPKPDPASDNDIGATLVNDIQAAEFDFDVPPNDNDYRHAARAIAINLPGYLAE